MRNWSTAAAAVEYSLGISYYIFTWYFALGGGAFISLAFLSSYPIAFSTILIVSFLFTGAGLFVWLSKNRRRLQAINPLLDITSYSATYQVLGGNRYRFIIRIAVRARVTGVDMYKFKFKWTGQGTNNVTVDPPEMRAIPIQHGQSSPWEVMRIQFSRPLAAKDERSFTICFELEDEAGTAVPVLAKNVDDFYVNGFTQKVTLPRAPTYFAREIYLSSRSEVAVYHKEYREPQTVELIWPQRFPRPGRKYTLVWRETASP